MSTYYVRDGILYTTKTLCNLKIIWQKECIVYPDEAKRIGQKQNHRSASLIEWFSRESPHPTSLIDWAAM